MHRITRVAAVAAAGLLISAPLTACGGDDGGEETTTTTAAGPVSATIPVGAEDSLRFDAETYEATAGTVRFILQNGGSLPHTLLIEGVDDFKLGVSGTGDDDEGTVSLEPGSYEMYCDVPGHRGAGMEATLTVE